MGVTRIEILDILNGVNEEILQAHTEIVALQKGGDNSIITGIDHLDYFLIGGLNNKMVFIGSRPSMGKTYNCETLINNLLDPEINKNQRIALLRMNLEMQTKSLLLRDLKKSLNKKMRDIISVEYTEAEKEIVKEVVTKHRDPRIINFSRLPEGEEFKFLLQEFCKKIDAQDTLAPTEKKTQKIVLIDHIHIYQSKKEIDEVLSICNEMKMSDPNLSFLIYFQFNRSLEEVWRDSKDKKANPKTFLPNSSHIYNTDALMQFADVVVGMTIPQVVDLDEFVSVYKDRNEHLKDHFLPSTSADNATVRLKGRNRIFYNYIKIRLVDDFEDPRLYCSVLNPEYETNVDKMYKEQSIPVAVASAPVFNMTTVMHNTDAMQAAAGKGFDDEAPF